MASDYCYGIEMKRALERHETGTVRVIPIILRRVYWEDAPFSKLQVLPTDAKPITQWQDRDEAYWNITLGILDAIKDLSLSLKTAKEWFDEGNTLRGLSRYEEALTAYEHSLRLDPTNAYAWNGKGFALYALSRYEEALTAYEHAFRLDPTYAEAWNNKDLALYALSRYEEALTAYEQALHLDPNYADAWDCKGFVLD